MNELQAAVQRNPLGMLLLAGALVLGLRNAVWHVRLWLESRQIPKSGAWRPR